MTTAQSPRADGIDLSDFEFWARPLEERFAAFATLRREPGLAFFAEPEPQSELIQPGPGYYAVVRHADIVTASGNPKIFSSASGSTSIPDMPPEFLEFFGSMINMDAPEHVRLRKIVSSGFTPRVMRQIEADIQKVASDIVDRVAAKGSCDFVSEVAADLPLQIICELMGVPREEEDMVFRNSNIILGAADPEYVPEGGDLAPVLLGAGAELSDLVQRLSRERRKNPTSDLVSALANAEVDGERLTDSEIGSFFVLLSVAGNETTRNAISHALVALTENPEQRQRWQADFEGVAPKAVEEIVRWSSPVTWMRRTVTTETSLGGQSLSPGDKLLLFYAAGNRDETVFDDPDSFNVTRDPNPHLGFGGAGPHHCLGAHLARREITVMYRELFRRLPDIHVAGEPQRLKASFVNGIKHLPAEFTPER